MKEHNEQVLFFKTCALYAVTDKRYDFIFAVPNAFKRTPRQGAWMKAEGLKAGVPDIVVAYPSKRYPALFIEMKTNKGRLQKSQREWLDKLTWAGYAATVCRGCDEALEVTRRYLADEIID